MGIAYTTPDTCSFYYNASGFISGDFHYSLAQDLPDQGFGLGAYTITAENKHPGLVFEYIFGFCSGLPNNVLPSVCINATDGSGGEECSGQALAYQHITTTWGYESCYRLSDCFHNQPRIEIDLLDPVEPAGGIYIKFNGGNTCPNSWNSWAEDKEECDTREDDTVGSTYCARSFKLNIKCHDEIDGIPEREDIIENAGCSYEATINHRLGCPVECPRGSNGRVCSSRGVCFYPGYDSGDTVDDTTASVPPLQCLCESGYYGTACEIEGYLNYQIQYIFVPTTATTTTHEKASPFMFLFFGLLIVIGFLFRKTLFEYLNGFYSFLDSKGIISFNRQKSYKYQPVYQQDQDTDDIRKRANFAKDIKTLSNTTDSNTIKTVSTYSNNTTSNNTNNKSKSKKNKKSSNMLIDDDDCDLSDDITI